MDDNNNVKTITKATNDHKMIRSTTNKYFVLTLKKGKHVTLVKKVFLVNQKKRIQEKS